jgi:hypothetical protein
VQGHIETRADRDAFVQSPEQVYDDLAAAVVVDEFKDYPYSKGRTTHANRSNILETNSSEHPDGIQPSNWPGVNAHLHQTCQVKIYFPYNALRPFLEGISPWERLGSQFTFSSAYEILWHCQVATLNEHDSFSVK